MKSLKFILITILATLSNFVAKGQYYELERYGLLEGLPNENISTVYQDSRSYLWIGTSSGLARYNGYEFEVINKSKGLNNNYIKCLFEDKIGKLWIGTNEGLNTFDLKSGVVESQFEGIIISDVLEFSEQIVFTSNQGLHILIEKDSAINFDIGRVRDIDIYNETLLIGTSAGLFKMSSKDSNPQKVNIANGDISLIRKILIHNDSIFLLSNSGIEILNSEFEILDHINETGVRTLFKDSKNRLFLGTINGFEIFKNNNAYSISNEIEINSDVQDFLSDHEGNMWIASGSGLYFFKEESFSRIESESLSENTAISSVLNSETEGILLGSTDGRIFELKDDELIIAEDYSSVCSGNTVQKLYEDSEKNLWISVLLKGLFVRSEDGIKEFTDPKNLLGNFTFDILEDSKNNIWFAGARGLGALKKDSFEYYEVFAESGSPFINQIIETRNGDILLAMNSGLGIVRDKYIYRLRNNKINSCTGIQELEKGQIVVSTKDQGVFEIGIVNDSLIIKKSYEKAAGLSNLNVNSLLKDSDGQVWIGTDYGINKLQEGNFQQYLLKNDLLRSKAYSNAIAENETNVFVGSNAGLFVIPKKESDSERKVVPCYITSINILNEDFDSTEVKSSEVEFNLPQELKLPYNANYLSFSFEGISFSSSEPLRYTYYLEGLKNEIVKSSNERGFTFSNLDPGNYTLHVSLETNDENVEVKPASFSFTIKKPYWQKWWFRIAAFLAFFTILFLIVNSRIQRIRREQQEKTEMDQKISEFRLTALRAQMNPHFIFNALYSIQHFITINQKEDAINYLTKFASLIRLILENSSNNEISIEKETMMLDLYLSLEQLRFDNKFQYEIDVDEEIAEEDTFIPYLMIQPFVENAIIHGIRNKEGNGKIKISILLQNEDYLKVSIEDDGVGREAAEKLKKPNPIKSQSLGLKVNKERLNILNPGKMEDTSVKIVDLVSETKDAMGTKVEITIPIS